MVSSSPPPIFCPLLWQAVSCAIIGSTVLLMSEEPLQGPRSPRNAAINDVDVCFSAFFITEFALKVVSMGFVLSRDAYLRDPWNGVDFLCVISSAVGLVPAYADMSAIKVSCQAEGGLCTRALANVRTGTATAITLSLPRHCLVIALSLPAHRGVSL